MNPPLRREIRTLARIQGNTNLAHAPTPPTIDQGSHTDTPPRVIVPVVRPPKPPTTGELRLPVGDSIVRRLVKPVGMALLLLTLATAHATTTVISGPQGAQPASVPSWCAAAAALGVSNVKCAPTLARGDGVADDSKPLQAAFTAGGKILLPCGTFLTQTLLVGNNTEIAGQGSCTILKHNNVMTSVPTQTSGCVAGANLNVRDMFKNTNDKCGNTNIYLHDLTVDMTNVTGPPTGGVPGNPASELAVDFQGVSNTKIERVYFLNTPQDAIYLRNGVKNSVDTCTFDGTNLQWGNGAAVNHETTTDAASPSADPVVVRNSTFILDGPAFCDNALGTKCDADGPCGAGHCIGGGVVGINVSAIQNGALAPGLIASDNTLLVSNYHHAIDANYAQVAQIHHNHIRAVATRAGGLTGFEKRLSGIRFYFTPSGTRPTNKDAVIDGNEIIGDTSVASTAFLAATKQQACIFVQGDATTTDNVVIRANVCRDLNLVAGETGITVYGTIGGSVSENRINNIQNGDAAVRLGATALAVSNESVLGNVIGPTTGASTEAIQFQLVTASSVMANSYTGIATASPYVFIGSNTVLIDDRQTVTFANLPSNSQTVDGSLVYCSNCTVASPCASGGTGGFAKHINGGWVCN
jgi:hypothetical protein